jgi:8-oxo-dGTP pyrophosphatase MutT (NUDIX family)
MGLLTRCWLCSAALLASSAHATEWQAALDLRLIHADGDTSYLNGGTGILRFDEKHDGLRLGRLRLGLTQNFGETWQQAAARELREETGVSIDADEIRHFRTHSSKLGDGVLLIFGVARSRSSSELPAFAPQDADASEMLVIKGKQKLAFPLHTQAVEEYFDEIGGGS